MVFDGITARHSHEGSIILEYSGLCTEDVGFEGYGFHGLLERSMRRWIDKNSGFVASRREGDAPQPAVQLRGGFQ